LIRGLTGTIRHIRIMFFYLAMKMGITLTNTNSKFHTKKMDYQSFTFLMVKKIIRTKILCLWVAIPEVEILC